MRAPGTENIDSFAADGRELAGLATSAAANDAPGYLIQRQLRHAKFDTTSRYIRAGELHRKNAAGMAGL
ncbi:MAG TPA: hypothetical protein VIK28_08590 [Sedimentisphaerales bacterium]